MYCSKCGAYIKQNAKFCPSCGEKITTQTIDISVGTDEAEIKDTAKQAPPKQKNTKPNMFEVWYYSKFAQTKKKKANTSSKGKKSRWVAFLLCLFTGWLGAHKFYTGKNMTGILYMFTFGLFGIGWIYDCIVLACFGGTDKNGKKLV